MLRRLRRCRRATRRWCRPQRADERIFWYERQAAAPDRDGLMDLAGVEIPSGAIAYLCGSVPFMRYVREQLLKAGVAARDIHYEVFGPDLWLAAGS